MKGFLESETEEFKQILVGIMDTSESRNRKAIAVEKFDLEVPETAHQISSGSFLILYLWNLYFIAYIVFFLFVFMLFLGESTCRLLRNLELFLKKSYIDRE